MEKNKELENKKEELMYIIFSNSSIKKKEKVYFKNGETYNERIKTYAWFRKLHS